MLRVFILCAEQLHTPDDDISDAYCSVTYEGRVGVVVCVFESERDVLVSRHLKNDYRLGVRYREIGKREK